MGGDSACPFCSLKPDPTPWSPVRHPSGFARREAQVTSPTTLRNSCWTLTFPRRHRVVPLIRFLRMPARITVFSQHLAGEKRFLLPRVQGTTYPWEDKVRRKDVGFQAFISAQARSSEIPVAVTAGPRFSKRANGIKIKSTRSARRICIWLDALLSSCCSALGQKQQPKS